MTDGADVLPGTGRRRRKNAGARTLCLLLAALTLSPVTACGKAGGASGDGTHHDAPPPAAETQAETAPPETEPEQADTTEREPAETDAAEPESETEAEMDYRTETWIALDLHFESEKSRGGGKELYLSFDAEFVNKSTGTTLTLPGFWYGGRTFTVRFAPTEPGEWTYRTICPTDPSLDAKTGTVTADPYTGDLAIYRHGFVTTNGSKHFVYADGTPFFYLGDTHWNMYDEEFDVPGPWAGDTGAEAQFRYIVDRRAEQGFTVYQSEPIGTGTRLEDGRLDASDAAAFAKNDRYYRYIAEKGLVHANAEFFFSSSMNADLKENEDYLEAISRYWAARYSAFPVMWTLAQEADNDFYHERGDQKVYDYSDNPWVLVAEYLHKYDAYNHPLSCHQENAVYTTVTGAGTSAADRDNGGRSAFASEKVTERTGHNWWAAQWSPNLGGQESGAIPRDYWESEKVAINYESRYCHLWTKDTGARMQSWIAMLSGFAGVGYGAADIWLYKGTYDLNTVSNDGLEQITVADKAVRWSEAVEFPSAVQQGIMRRFFEGFNWWDLKPDFTDGTVFWPENSFYAAASVGNELYVIYLYSRNKNAGTVLGLDPEAVYEAAWFDPRTGEPSLIGEVRAASSWKAPAKPDAEDYVLFVRKK